MLTASSPRLNASILPASLCTSPSRLVAYCSAAICAALAATIWSVRSDICALAAASSACDGPDGLRCVNHGIPCQIVHNAIGGQSCGGLELVCPCDRLAAETAVCFESRQRVCVPLDSICSARVLHRCLYRLVSSFHSPIRNKRHCINLSLCDLLPDLCA